MALRLAADCLPALALAGGATLACHPRAGGDP
jgi:hypothetical protein